MTFQKASCKFSLEYESLSFLYSAYSIFVNAETKFGATQMAANNAGMVFRWVVTALALANGAAAIGSMGVSAK